MPRRWPRQAVQYWRHRRPPPRQCRRCACPGTANIIFSRQQRRHIIGNGVRSSLAIDINASNMRARFGLAFRKPRICRRLCTGRRFLDALSADKPCNPSRAFPACRPGRSNSRQQFPEARKIWIVWFRVQLSVYRGDRCGAVLFLT